MNRKKLLITFATVVAFALMVWTIGATVNLSAINFSASPGDVVSASDFNTAFGTVDDNFAQLQNAVPGVAQDLNTGTPVMFDGTLQTVLSTTIDVPESGFVVVHASGYAEIDHTSGVTSTVLFGLSDDAAGFGAAQDVDLTIPAGQATGFFDVPFSSHAVFTVASAGSHTFNLLAQRTAGAGGRMADVTITGMYVPMSYGSVTSASFSSSAEGVDDR